MIDTAFGAIPLRVMNGTTELLLVAKKKLEGGVWWGLPKGHAEENETPLAAATRELFEETGIDGASLDAKRQYTDHYQFERDGTRVEKTVTYFLCMVPETEPVDVDRTEVVDYRWMPLAEAVHFATYPQLRSLLQTVAGDLHIPVSPPPTVIEE